MTVSIQSNGFKPVPADLWGHEFETVSLTRSKGKAFAALELQLGDLDDESPEAVDRAVEIVGQMLDIILASTDAKRSKPSKLIADKWEADEISFGSILQFVEELQTERPI